MVFLGGGIWYNPQISNPGYPPPRYPTPLDTQVPRYPTPWYPTPLNTQLPNTLPCRYPPSPIPYPQIPYPRYPTPPPERIWDQRYPTPWKGHGASGAMERVVKYISKITCFEAGTQKGFWNFVQTQQFGFLRYFEIHWQFLNSYVMWLFLFNILQCLLNIFLFSFHFLCSVFLQKSHVEYKAFFCKVP